MVAAQQLSPADVQSFAQRLIGGPVTNANLLPPLLSALQLASPVVRQCCVMHRRLRISLMLDIPYSSHSLVCTQELC